MLPLQRENPVVATPGLRPRLILSSLIALPNGLLFLLFPQQPKVELIREGFFFFKDEDYSVLCRFFCQILSKKAQPREAVRRRRCPEKYLRPSEVLVSAQDSIFNRNGEVLKTKKFSRGQVFSLAFERPVQMPQLELAPASR